MCPRVSEEACAGSDDRRDVDADAIPDGCDDWPCGVKPADPGDPAMDAAGSRQWSASSIGIGSMRRAVVTPGATIPYAFDFRFQIDCMGQNPCKGQLEIGYQPGGLIDCAPYDGNVISNQLKSGSAQATLTAPSAPGSYDIRINVGRRGSCGSSWFGSTPSDDSTIARLCVK